MSVSLRHYNEYSKVSTVFLLVPVSKMIPVNQIISSTLFIAVMAICGCKSTSKHVMTATAKPTLRGIGDLTAPAQVKAVQMHNNKPPGPLFTGATVQVFFRAQKEPADPLWVAVDTKFQGTSKPLIGWTDGWQSATVVQDFTPGVHETVKVQLKNRLWYDRSGNAKTEYGGLTTQEFKPEDVTAGAAPEPVLSIFSVRWGGPSFDAVNQWEVNSWGSTGSSVSDKSIK